MAIKKPPKHSNMSQLDLKVAPIEVRCNNSSHNRDMNNIVMLICKVRKASNNLKQFDLIPLFLLFNYLEIPVF